MDQLIENITTTLRFGLLCNLRGQARRKQDRLWLNWLRQRDNRPWTVITEYVPQEHMVR